MNTLWRALGGLCAAVLVMVTVFGAGVAPAQAEVCTELLVNGGFEADAGWQLGPSPVMPQYVTYTRHGGYRSLSLGITSGANIESFSSARQTVSIPASAPQVLLSFWFYAMADSPATTDYMEVVLLDATGVAIVNKPWLSHNDSRVWNQLTFDLTPWRGQTVQLYFNVYNDGVGGRAAMFLDDISLASCSGVAAPTGTVTTIPTVAPTLTLTAGPSATPGCVTSVINGGFESGLASWEPQGDSRGTVLSATAPHSGGWALRLGALDQSINGFTSVRQQVIIPTGFAQVKLEFWTYTFLEADAGNDYQRTDLLNTSGNPLAVLWNEATDKRAWERREVDLASYAGQTVFLRFGVNNDGIGGRAAMYLDDVRIQGCNPGPTPTLTPVPSQTPAATASVTAVVPGCTPLIKNGGFEDSDSFWQIGPNVLPAQRVGDSFHAGFYAMQMGSQTENRNSYSSIRQAVLLPWDHPRLVVSFWAYTWTEASSDEFDEQQFILLDQQGVVWKKLWSVLEGDEADWRQKVFVEEDAAGQSLSLYFNAINDGVGGRTALLVDEVSAWACTPGECPDDLKAGGASCMPRSGASSRTPGPTLTLTPYGMLRTPLDKTADTPASDLTRIALQVTPQTLVGTSLATATPTSGIKSPTDDGKVLFFLATIWDRLKDLTKQWPPGWPLLIALIVALLLFILVRGWLRRQ